MTTFVLSSAVEAIVGLASLLAIAVGMVCSRRHPLKS
jgi:hypothetical protein